MQTAVRVKKSKGTHSQGPPQYCEFYFQELYQVLTVNIREKISSCFWQGKGERNHSEIQQNILVFLTRSLFRRNQFTKLNLPGYCQGLTDLEERKFQLYSGVDFHIRKWKYPIPAHSMPSNPYKGDKNNQKTLVKFIPRGIGSPKD